MWIYLLAVLLIIVGGCKECSAKDAQWLNPCSSSSGQVGEALQSPSPYRQSQASPLKGLRNVELLPQISSVPGGIDSGLTEEIRGYAALRLKNLGVNVRQSMKHDAAYVHMVGTYFSEAGGSIHYSASVQVFQIVRLERDSKARFSILTWQQNREGSAENKVAVLTKLEEALNLLFSDWLSANPKGR